jgi:hypothetical protein
MFIGAFVFLDLHLISPLNNETHVIECERDSLADKRERVCAMKTGENLHDRIPEQFLHCSENN